MTSNGVFNENGNRKMTEEPKLEWGGEAEYLTGIGLAGLKDVSVEKPGAGAYRKYTNLKDLAHEES